MVTEVTAPHEVSSSLEKVLEHRFVAALTTHLWLTGITEVEVLRGEVDCHGYDLVIEANGVLRHIQLKAMIRGGKRRDVGVNVRLASKPSGCVVWMVYDPATLELGPFLWFGGEPGSQLPPLGERVGRHSKGNAEGMKLERRRQRQVEKRRFAGLTNIGDLSVALFGPANSTVEPVQEAIAATPEEELALLKRHLAQREEPQGPDWLRAAHGGDFSKVPESLDFKSASELAHLIDGFELVRKAGWGDPLKHHEAVLSVTRRFGIWPAGAASLWAMLFFELRCLRLTSMAPAEATFATIKEVSWRMVKALQAA